MSDIETDIECKIPSPTDETVNLGCELSDVTNQKHRTNEIEHLLKDLKQYSLTKNSPKLKSWICGMYSDFPIS